MWSMAGKAQAYQCSKQSYYMWAGKTLSLGFHNRTSGLICRNQSNLFGVGALAALFCAQPSRSSHRRQQAAYAAVMCLCNASSQRALSPLDEAVFPLARKWDSQLCS